jgi:hypothetical protein
MNPAYPVVSFHEVLRSLTGLPDGQQTTTLKIELFHAIERAHEGRLREQALEQEIARLRAEGASRSQEHNAFAAWLDAEFAQAKRALDRVRDEREERLGALRVELIAAETQCDILEATCRSLLLTLEHAAVDDAAVDDTAVDDTWPDASAMSARPA